jgi:3-oxoacyl-[acyl-carrier protein] reductase
MDLGIEGKTALITASTKGLGRATAEYLADQGCNIAVSSSDPANVEKTAEEMRRKFGAVALVEKCDLDKPDEIEQFYNAVVERFGGVDVLVNNCGGPPAGYFENFGEEEWRGAYEQVLMSAVRFTKLALPNMKAKRWGRIVTITSISVKQPVENLILSTTFRAGIIGMQKTLASELAPYGITINSVAPGYILTDRLRNLAAKKSEQTGRSIEGSLKAMGETAPAGTLGEPLDIAATVAFLASERARYLTGNTIHVDGGLVKALL